MKGNKENGSIREEIIDLILEIEDPWILRQIYRYIKAITKED